LGCHKPFLSTFIEYLIILIFSDLFSADTSSIDELVKSLKTLFFVIPANPGSWSGAGAGIQFFQLVTEFLDSGFHRSDDFLRNCQYSFLSKTGRGTRFRKEEFHAILVEKHNILIFS